MPCEIKELVINTTINQDLSTNENDKTDQDSTVNESYLLHLINAEINKAKPKIINDCIDHFNENNRIHNQR
jgi:hypothetical protein